MGPPLSASGPSNGSATIVSSGRSLLDPVIRLWLPLGKQLEQSTSRFCPFVIDVFLAMIELRATTPKAWMPAPNSRLDWVLNATVLLSSTTDPLTTMPPATAAEFPDTVLLLKAALDSVRMPPANSEEFPEIVAAYT